MSAAWTAAYMRYGSQHEQEFDTLRQAVAFASRGVETWDYSVERITGPDGEVIEGDELDEATLHIDLGGEDYDRARVAKWRPRLDQETP